MKQDFSQDIFICVPGLLALRMEMLYIRIRFGYHGCCLAIYCRFVGFSAVTGKSAS